MGLTPAQRKANQRARQKGIPEPYGPDFVAQQKAEQDVHAEMSSTREQNFAWAQEQDATGKYYRSECRPLTTLLQIYEGAGLEVVDPTDEAALLEKAKVDAKKKITNLPIPFLQPIQIRAINFEGVNIDPNNKQHRKTYEVDGVVSFERWLELRDKARKDLFWLARLLQRNFYHNTHQVICDAFVQKNFDGMYFPECNLDDVHEMIGAQKRFATTGEPTRTLLLFAPRSGYKSTADGVDAVQWMLNCPDIRIMIMTSVQKLSKQLMGEIKGYFNLPDRGKPSAFQLLFPEYVLRGIDGRSDSPIECPAQMFDTKEPHIWVTSLDSSFVGQRCDIRKLDDVVEDKNSSNDELRESLKEKIKSTNALVEPWGFTDVIGTRYFTTDWYGWRMGQAPDPDDIEGATEPFAYLCIPCYTPKPEFEVEYKRLLEETGGVFKIREEMVDFWFPYKLGWSALRTKLREYKERGFKNQYLNIATDPYEESGFKISFTEQALRSHMYQREAAPRNGDIYIVWDWALSDKKTSDFSVGVVARLYKNDADEWSFVVLEVLYDKWKYSELAYQIVALSRKYNPKVTMIESSNGYEMLRDEIGRVGQKQSYQPYIYWKQPSREENAKRNRIKSTEILLAEHRIHFVLGPWIDELIKQYINYTGEKKNKGRKDDICDAIGYLNYILPASARPLVEHVDPNEERRLLEEQDKQFRKARHYEAYFGSSIRTQKEGGNSQAPKLSQWRQGYQADVAPQPAPEPVVEEVKPQDPRMRIFGNNRAFRL